MNKINNKKILLSLMFALIILQISVIGAMFIKTAAIKKYAVNQNTIIRLNCSAYDPFHPLKGRYAQLQINWEDVKKTEDLNGGVAGVGDRRGVQERGKHVYTYTIL